MKRGRLIWAAFTVPGGAILLFLFIAPLAMVLLYSVGTVDFIGRPRFGHTLANFHEVFQPFYLPVIWRTIGYAAITTAVCLVLGYPLAYFATQFAGRFGPFIIGAIILTWLVDYLVRIYAWTAIFDDNGIVNNALHAVGIPRIHIFPGTVPVLVGLVYCYLPLMVLPLYASLGDLNRSVIEAGKDLYGTPRQTFWHVTLPATTAGVVGGMVLTFFPALGDFATAQFLGGPNQSMIGNIINTQFTDSGSATFGSALTVVLLGVLVIGLIAGLVIRSQRFRSLWRIRGQVTVPVVQPSQAARG
jgi:spermidine/putrescine transport system permease protein